jgi:hypothetical protein
MKVSGDSGRLQNVAPARALPPAQLQAVFGSRWSVRCEFMLRNFGGTRVPE